MNQSTPPKEFLCSGTGRLMSHPWQDQNTGKHYDRQTVFEYMFFGVENTPTLGPLHPSQMRPNIELERRIEAWKSVSRHSGVHSEHTTRPSDAKGGYPFPRSAFGQSGKRPPAAQVKSGKRLGRVTKASRLPVGMFGFRSNGSKAA